MRKTRDGTLLLEERLIMKITVEQAAQAVAAFMAHPLTDEDTIAAIFGYSFAIVKDSNITINDGMVDFELEDGFTTDDAKKEFNL